MRRSNPLVMVLVAAALVVAAGHAAAQTYLIEVQAGGPGTVAPPGPVQIPAGGSQTFTFMPDVGNLVADVTVDDVSVGSGLTQYTFTNVQSDHVLYVSFAPAPTYLLEVQTSGPGTVAPGTVQVFAGTNQTFTFTPGACSSVDDVTVDDVSLGAGLTEYTFTNVQSGHVLYVSFAADPTTTTTTLDVRPVTGQCAVPETLTATVPNADGGQVQFFNGATLLATRPLVAGVARFFVSRGLPSGLYTFSASYLGTNCLGPSNSAPVPYDIADTGPTPVTLSLTLNSHTVDQHSTLSASATLQIDGVVAGAQNGQVTFYDGNTMLGTAAMTAGRAGWTTRMDVPGAHVFRAVASLDQCPGTIASESESLFVREFTSMTLTITPMQVDPGESVVMTAELSPSYATGTAHFLDVVAAVEIGSASLVDGVATLAYGPLSASRMIQARYDGDALVAACTSSQAFLQVGRSLPPVVDTTLWITNGPVSSVVVDGSTIYLGGNFTWVGPATGGPGVTRNHIAALDAATGAATAWDPNADGVVSDIVVSGGTVYAGGNFTHIGGKTRSLLAALDAATGAATAWNPSPAGTVLQFGPWVNALAANGGTIYVGGAFAQIGGQARSCIAEIDAATGDATAWNPNATGGTSPLHNGIPVPGVTMLTRSGATVYAAGPFTGIGGQVRRRIAALEAASGAATLWAPNVNGSPDPSYDVDPYVNALAVNGSTVFVGGYFSEIDGDPRNYIAALDATSGAVTNWNPSANGIVDALAVSGSTVYVSGTFTSIGARPRNHIAALDAATGGATDWDPGVNGFVVALAVSGGKVYVGGDFTSIGGKPQAHIAAISASNILVSVSPSERETPSKSDLRLLSSNPTYGGARMQYSVARAGRVRLEVLDVSGRVEATLADWIHSPGRYVVAWDGIGRRGRSSPGLYFVRLVTRDQVMMRKLAIIR